MGPAELREVLQREQEETAALEEALRASQARLRASKEEVTSSVDARRKRLSRLRTELNTLHAQRLSELAAASASLQLRESRFMALSGAAERVEPGSAEAAGEDGPVGRLGQLERHVESLLEQLRKADEEATRLHERLAVLAVHDTAAAAATAAAARQQNTGSILDEMVGEGGGRTSGDRGPGGVKAGASPADKAASAMIQHGGASLASQAAAAQAVASAMSGRSTNGPDDGYGGGAAYGGGYGAYGSADDGSDGGGWMSSDGAPAGRSGHIVSGWSAGPPPEEPPPLPAGPPPGAPTRPSTGPTPPPQHAQAPAYWAWSGAPAHAGAAAAGDPLYASPPHPEGAAPVPYAHPGLAMPPAQRGAMHGGIAVHSVRL